MSEPKPSRGKLVRRACDACKIRKIKCSETPPCTACTASGIDCTFHERQGTRGPRNLRVKTRLRIAQTQLQSHGQPKQPALDYLAGASTPSIDAASAAGYSDDSASLGDPPPSHGPSSQSRVPDLINFIHLYSQRLYPVWPIIDTEALIQELSASGPCDPRTLLLAEAIRMGAIAQLRLPDSPASPLPDAHDGCADLTALRTSFFRHVFYENLEPGCPRSIIHLREALTIAQILRLDRESSYTALPEPEQQMRRRIIWLLFVTERGVAMLYELPVVLRPNTFLPAPHGEVLTSFLKLVNLFWSFQASGIFDTGILQSDADVPTVSAARDSLELLQASLSQMPVDTASSNDVQRADLFVTGQWMRAVLWRAASRIGMASNTIADPIRIARDLLSFVAQVPQAAIDAHGSAIEFKTFEIASAVIDAMAHRSTVPSVSLDEPEQVLQGLQRMLSSSRGGNRALLASLWLKMATLQRSGIPSPLTFSPLQRVEELVDDGSGNNLSCLPHGSNQFGSMPGQASAWADLEELLQNGMLGRISGISTPRDRMGDSSTGQNMTWPPFEINAPFRTPSPITRMILDQLQTATTEDMSPLSALPWSGLSPGP
ncbi:RNA polymerase II-specific transcription factor-like protein [Microdochium nivale]|nr:RNA polymerase II-specific transcription factor-like protein [Microdochium nivale]